MEELEGARGFGSRPLRGEGLGGGCVVGCGITLHHTGGACWVAGSAFCQEAALGLGCSDSLSVQLFLSYTRIILFKVTLNVCKEVRKDLHV